MFDILSRLLRYLRLKSRVSLIRFFIWWNNGLPTPHPDSILYIPSRSPNRSITAHVYHSLSASQSKKTPTPVHINFHGSGFVLPLHGADDAFCRKLSSETHATVLDIKYRLAPEHPFPAAVEDAQDVVDYVLAHPSQYDPDSITIGGFSAGANLSLVQAGSIFPKDTFKSVLCFYPPCDIATAPEEKVDGIPDKSGHPIPIGMDKLFSASYVPPAIDRADPRISPSYADFETLPKNLLMISCACDSLCMEAEALAANIEKAGEGRNVVRRRMDKCDHGWDKKAQTSAEVAAREEAYALAVDMLKL